MQKKLVLVGLLCLISMLEMHTGFAENLIEFRDRNNQFTVYIDSTTSNLVGANLDASAVNRGTLGNSRLDSSSVTLQGNTFNAASKLVQLDGSTALPAVSGAALTTLNASNLASGTVANARLDSTSVTLQGNTFNTASKLLQLDGSAFVPGANLDPSSVTKQGNTFNGASQLVQLNGSSQLPAVSGVNLTNLNASNLASGTVGNARLDSSSVTLQGNTFNGNSQLIKTTTDGKYPALDGSNITNVTATTVNASSVTAGTFQSGSYSFPSALTINSLVLYGAVSGATLRASACSSSKCLAFNTDDFDLYTSTGSGVGSWRNSRSGIAP